MQAIMQLCDLICETGFAIHRYHRNGHLEKQLLGYLRTSRIEHGLLVNFGAAKFQIKKYILNDDILPF